ncbi:MAG: Swt1 family HEPN domain-containing protein [Terriglobales bacterium]
MKDEHLSLFLMLGQTSQKAVSKLPETIPPQHLMLSATEDLALVLPNEVRRATKAAETYRLFFVFENFIRDFVLETLSEIDPVNWWDKVPKDVQDEVQKLEETEQQKQWIALDSRSKLALTTLPQLLRIIDETKNWNDIFKDLVRDKFLIQEGRSISHLRNTICHMSDISDEETDRVKQVMRDWFRVVAP